MVPGMIHDVVVPQFPVSCFHTSALPHNLGQGESRWIVGLEDRDRQQCGTGHGGDGDLDSSLRKSRDQSLILILWCVKSTPGT